MADSDGISGLGVGAAGVGFLLIAAAIRNETPLDTVRSVLGKSVSGTPISSTLDTSTGKQIRTVKKVDGKIVTVTPGVAGGKAGAIVSAAQKYLGVPYKYGGTSANGIDCSGLCVLALRAAGYTAPRFYTATFDSWARSQGWKRVAPADFQQGDVIRRPGHMAIALSNSRMIHAPRPGKVVTEASIYSKNQWWGFRPD